MLRPSWQTQQLWHLVHWRGGRWTRHPVTTVGIADRQQLLLLLLLLVWSWADGRHWRWSGRCRRIVSLLHCVDPPLLGFLDEPMTRDILSRCRLTAAARLTFWSYFTLGHPGLTVVKARLWSGAQSARLRGRVLLLLLLLLCRTVLVFLVRRRSDGNFNFQLLLHRWRGRGSQGNLLGNGLELWRRLRLDDRLSWQPESFNKKWD